MPFESLTGHMFSDDPLVKIENRLKQALPAELPVYRHTLPEKWHPGKGAAIVIAEDATQVSETAYERVLIRINVHTASFDLSRRLGRSIYEYLLNPMHSFSLSISRSRSSRPIVGPDSLAGGYVSTGLYSCGTSRKVYN